MDECKECQKYKEAAEGWFKKFNKQKEITETFKNQLKKKIKSDDPLLNDMLYETIDESYKEALENAS